MTRIEERGSVTAFTAVLGLALLICAGLVVDGGAKIQAYREAYAVAEEAARAGAGQVDIDHAYAGGRFEIDASRALAAARAYLSSSGHSGNASLSGNRTVQVTVTVSRPTVLISLIGIGSVTATASASARMFQGIEQGRS
ncbi:pilus assembly protein TadG-related protein [Microbispora catharanthi]|uniref:pilus assembly protein TadG-related protein n=1 Tax=Microbispora catharanthi TaxID=1712871 RepID=UPI0013766F5D|nr:pilus assembly protein TadG-related protein [Microbispora catharanthi]